MSELLPIVLQLQADAMNSEVPVAKLLRLAKTIATKLDQKEALSWINAELDGYPNAKTKEEMPKYRLIEGQPKGYNPYHGWVSINFSEPDQARKFSIAPLNQSVPSLEKTLMGDRKGQFMFPYPPDAKRALQKSLPMQPDVALFLSESSLWDIVEGVRNLVLDWSLELEKAGVLGEKMTFSEAEKKEGATVTQNYIIQNVGVLGNVSDNAKVTNAQTAIVALDIAAVKDIAGKVLGALRDLPPEVRPKLGALMNEIRTEADKDAPDQSKLRGWLSSAREIAINVAGNLTASGIGTMIGALLGAG